LSNFASEVRRVWSSIYDTIMRQLQRPAKARKIEAPFRTVRAYESLPLSNLVPLARNSGVSSRRLVWNDAKATVLITARVDDEFGVSI
jgi:long-subunit acyl-CoA synthetase (AMP-forming)